jgi:hypothetical protein
MTESALKLESGVAVSNAAYAPVERKRYVDVFRGLLIAHMALDQRRSCSTLGVTAKSWLR